MKEIWFISHYSMPPHLEQRVKTLRYASIMKSMGYKTRIFSASTIHNTDIDLIEGKEKYIEKTYDDLDYVHIKVPHYHGNGLSRIINLKKFSKGFCKAAKHFESPYAIVADVNCVNFQGIYKYCKKHKVKFFTDIRDLWPLSIIEYLGFSKGNPIIKYLFGQEKKLYKVSDGVIFSMEGGRQYIIEKGWDKKIDLNKVHYINNGVDLDMFQQQIIDNKFADEDLDDDTFKVIYCGSIRLANNVGLLVDAAKKFSKGDNVKFVFYGDGEDIANLKQRCLLENIDNVVFKGKVNKNKIPYILSKSNLNILNYKKADTWKYGGSQNKMFEYLASGKPILSTIKIGYSLIERYNCGVEINDQTAENIYDVIKIIKNLPQEQYDSMCQNAKEGAKDFDFKVLADKLVKIIEG